MSALCCGKCQLAAVYIRIFVSAFTVAIQDDAAPELDESIVIYLGNAQGGAMISSRHRQVELIIAANDIVGGRIRFSDTFVSTSEGQSLRLLVLRSQPAEGRVLLRWNITSISGAQPQSGFKETRGALYLNPVGCEIVSDCEKTLIIWFRFQGQLNSSLDLEVRADKKPELEEVYMVTLINVSTVGVGEEGAAILDAQGSSVQITVRASDRPHGQFALASQSQQLEIEETVGVLSLLVQRLFGLVGSVRVYFQVLSERETTLRPLAVNGKDFRFNETFVDFADQQAANNITLQVVNDATPEVDEYFVIRLSSVELLSSGADDFPPTLGAMFV